MIRTLDRVALVATLACPIFLLHGRGIAEAMIDATALAFLTRSALAGDWRWLRTPWVPIAGTWWLWLVVCSVPGIGQGGAHSFLEALAVVRFLLFTAALEHRVLAEARPRRWMGWLVSAATLYIAAQAMLQFATGRNLFGEPRAPDGTLTGPFGKERAGPPFSRLIFPAVLPPAWRLVSRPGAWGKLAAALLVLATVTVQVLFGQRMPVLLVGLGLGVSAILLPRLRVLALGAGVAVLALVAASAAIDPPAFHRLVTLFSHQMATFPQTEYGLIAGRAVAMLRASPWTGHGFDAFRFACADPRFFHGWYGGNGGGAAICVQHPHNHYLQAAIESGLPGLALFSAMVLAWLICVGRGLWRAPDPLRVGLFVAVLVQEWPIASASDFVDMPLGGWFFLLLGFGLACARAVPEVAGARRAPYIADSKPPIPERRH